MREFNSIEELLEKEEGRFRVVIFGSSKVEAGDIVYERVKNMANMLGARGIDLVTGGGPGLMEAASEGHKLGDQDNKARCIGVGVDLPWNQRFNNGVEFKEQAHVFSERLDRFMLLSNAVIVAPGGLGTLLELFYTWQLVQVHLICNIPIILVGDMWEGLLKWIKEEPLKSEYLKERDYDLVFHAKDETEVMDIIDYAHDHFKQNKEDVCLNYKKYKLK